MKRVILIILALTAFWPALTAVGQRVKKVGPTASLTKEQIGDSVVAIYQYYQKYRTDLTDRLAETDDTTIINALLMQYDVVEMNCNQHIFNFCEYYTPTSPDALEFIFSLRTIVPKEHIAEIYGTLKGKNKKLPYAELINTYIMSKQAQMGESAINFEATTFENTRFDLSELLAKKNVIIVFGGIDRISERDLTWLNMVYNGVDQSKTEMIYFDPTATSCQQLAELRKERGVDWNFISDFKGDWSPATLAYNVQATPTFVYVTKEGVMADWSVGDLQAVINNLAK